MEENPWITLCRHTAGLVAQEISSLDPLHNGVFLGLFLAGLAGSAAHCVPMCGPFVLAQVSARLETVPIRRLCEWHRIDSALALPYHLGRLTTYGLLGALAAGVGAAITAGPRFTLASSCLLIAAACLFFAEAGGRIAPGFSRSFKTPLDRSFAWIGHRFSRLAAGLNSGTRRGSYGFGLMVGFLPCAFLYAALTAAAATANPFYGALAMISFGAGTIPALVSVALVGQGVGHRWRSGLAGAAPYLLTLNGILLGAIGITRLIRL